jgi:hypothetical protein
MAYRRTFQTNQGQYFNEFKKGQEAQADSKHVHAIYKMSEACSRAFGIGGREGGRSERWDGWTGENGALSPS